MAEGESVGAVSVKLMADSKDAVEGFNNVGAAATMAGNRVSLALNEAKDKALIPFKQEIRNLRMEHFVMIQSMMALSFLMQTFNTEHATSEVKKLFGSMQQGLSLGMAAGFTAMFIPGLQAFVPLISIAGTAVGTFIGYLNAANEAAEKAATEGLKDFTKQIEQLTPGQMEKAIGNVDERLAAVNRLLKEADSNFTKVAAASRMGGFGTLLYGGAVTAEDKAKAELQKRILEDMKADLEKQVEQRKVLELVQAETTKALDGQLNRVLQIDATLLQLNKKRKEGLILDTNGQRIADEIQKLEKEKANLQSTSDGLVQKLLTAEEGRMKAGNETKKEYLEHVTLLLKMKMTDEQRLKIQDAIANAELKANKEAQEAFKSREEFLQADISGAVKGRRDAIEAEKMLDELLDKPKAGDKVGMAKQDADNYFNEQKKKIDALAIEQTQKDELLAESRKNADRMVTEAQKEHEAKVFHKQQQDMQDLITSARELGDALANAMGQGGDSFIRKMITALQIVMQIQKTMAAINENDKVGGSTTSLYMQLGAQLLGIGGLFGFAGGGYTGSGPRNRIAGVVHGGEMVFEKPIVDRYGSSLMELRAAMQRGYSDGGSVAEATAAMMRHSVGDSNATVRSALRNVKVQAGDVYLVGTLEGQHFLRKEMPYYDRFNAFKKRTD